MSLLHRILDTVAAGHDPGPFALLTRHGNGHADVLRGDVTVVDRLADIPLPPGAGPRTLALVPFRQVAERGFACVDDDAPLECLRIAEHESTTDLLAALPAGPVGARHGAFDIPDREYADSVTAVLTDEIGRGEGANFVLHRTYTATVDAALPAALRTLRNLLRDESGAYWTFLVHTGTRTMVGATPERHVSVVDGLTMMNPISGTFRHPDGPPDSVALLAFLDDRKETEELYMVLDEELKMMATVATDGGQVVGPYLKGMAHLTHTEYLLAGRSTRDVRDTLRETMFAPTVTGSPMENACRVIARRERRGRRYYAAVLALLGHDDDGRQTLDAPILIRTAEFTGDGTVRVPVGATLVRHSTAAGEVAETYAKSAGIRAALELAPARPRTPASSPSGDDPRVRASLAARNDGLARFWLEQRRPGELTVPELAGRRAVIVDGEDTFTGMLAHQLRALGLDVTIRPWQATGPLDADLVVLGPGPGDPADPVDPKMRVLGELTDELLADGRPLLAICLSHQILAGRLGLTLHRRDAPYQGVARDVELFGTPRRVGFYSTFTALADADLIGTGYGPVAVARDPDGTVHALRGTGFAGLQFHPESVLSRDGVAVLTDLLPPLLRSAGISTRAGG